MREVVIIRNIWVLSGNRAGGGAPAFFLSSANLIELIKTSDVTECDNPLTWVPDAL